MLAVPDTYIAIDLETTGLNPKVDRVIELACYKVEGGVVKDSKATLINPKMHISEEISKLTEIDDSMVVDAPQLEEVFDDLAVWLGDYPLLGHRVIFDYSFLKRYATNHNIEFDKYGIDTLKLCRMIMPGDVSKTLKSACEYYQLDEGAYHRAASDAMSAHNLYQAIAKYATESNISAWEPKKLFYKVKKEQKASKRQKELLRKLLNYHKIDTSVDIDSMTKNEISRYTDKIILQHGRMIET